MVSKWRLFFLGQLFHFTGTRKESTRQPRNLHSNKKNAFMEKTLALTIGSRVLFHPGKQDDRTKNPDNKPCPAIVTGIDGGGTVTLNVFTNSEQGGSPVVMRCMVPYVNDPRIEPDDMDLACYWSWPEN